MMKVFVISLFVVYALAAVLAGFMRHGRPSGSENSGGWDSELGNAGNSLR